MLVYLAGPIRPKDGKTMEQNVAEAKEVALSLWQAGYTVICPHANTDLPISLADKAAEENVWLNGDLEILARCNALIVLPNWRGSKGTEGELSFANKRGIPVYEYPDLPKKTPTELHSPVQCKAFIDTIMAMYRLHLKKNSDYSPANIIGTGELGVVVRLWDKIARLLNLHGFRMHVESSTFEAPREPKNESIEDAYYDTAVELLNNLNNEVKQLKAEKFQLVRLLMEVQTVISLGDLYSFEKRLELSKRIQEVISAQENH